jgi:multicomponent Na+:H+ antiporter subunit F
MMAIAMVLALVLLGAGLLSAVARLILGPTLADRILALDLATLLGAGVIAVFAVQTGIYTYLDLAVALVLVSFVATVAFARYLLSGDRK